MAGQPSEVECGIETDDSDGHWQSERTGYIFVEATQHCPVERFVRYAAATSRDRRGFLYGVLWVPLSVRGILAIDLKI